jgi:hypothetical protein
MTDRAIICGEGSLLYRDAQLTVPSGTTLYPQTEIEIRSIGQSVQVALPDGTLGYVPTNVKIRRIQAVFLNQREVTVHQQSSAMSPIVWEMERGEEFLTLELVKADDGDWIRVRRSNGDEGFLRGDVKVTAAAELRAEMANRINRGCSVQVLMKELRKQGIAETAATRLITEAEEADTEVEAAPDPLVLKYERHMVCGILWAVGGTIATVEGYRFAASSPGGGKYIVFWGAIVFGAVDFFRGLFGVIRCSR